VILDWAHAGPAFVAAFLASLVEFVEALTVVLAIGVVRGWRDALAGVAAATLVLLALVALLGSLLTRIPLASIQLFVGALLLMFGLRWLRKAILRSAGIIAMHDEAAIYARQTRALSTGATHAAGWDKVGFAAAFKITMLEGIEVVFTVIAIGVGGSGLMWAASLGAVVAFFVVLALGVVVHRPLARVPENTLKFAVGVLLSGFGTFWVGEGIGVDWPLRDWSILALVTAYLATALVAVRACRARRVAA
jgi:Ca2+/H+ antiporter, TMEM165/GDT1 family